MELYLSLGFFRHEQKPVNQAFLQINQRTGNLVGPKPSLVELKLVGMNFGVFPPANN